MCAFILFASFSIGSKGWGRGRGRVPLTAGQVTVVAEHTHR